MHANRRKAKAVLDNASKTKYYGIVDEAKIFKDDKEILDAKFVDGLSIVAIAVKYGYSVEKVNHSIRRCYDKVYGVIEGA